MLSHPQYGIFSKDRSTNEESSIRNQFKPSRLYADAFLPYHQCILYFCTVLATPIYTIELEPLVACAVIAILTCGTTSLIEVSIIQYTFLKEGEITRNSSVPHLLLQLKDSIHQRLTRRWASRHIDIHGDNPIAPSCH